MTAGFFDDKWAGWESGNPPSDFDLEELRRFENTGGLFKCDNIVFFLLAVSKPYFYSGRASSYLWWGWFDKISLIDESTKNPNDWCTKNDPNWDYIYKVENNRCVLVYNRFFSNRNLEQSEKNKKCLDCNGTGVYTGFLTQETCKACSGKGMI